jgi:hypothetical protein
MGTQDGPRQYVTWADAIEAMRYFEAGYGGRILMKAVQACPKGEQYPKLYFELFLCDAELNPRPLAGRVLAQFPSQVHKTVPGMLLALLYRLDAVASQSHLWTEPTIAAKPRVVPQD